MTLDYLSLVELRTPQAEIRVGVKPDGTVEKPEGMTEAEALALTALSFAQHALAERDDEPMFEFLSRWGITRDVFLPRRGERK